MSKQHEHDRDRPGAGAASSVNNGDEAIESRGTDRTVLQRRRWALGLIGRAPSPCPHYGSPEWLALPDGDPRKVGAVVVAAECWAQYGDTLEDDLRAELDAAWRAHKNAEDSDYQARAAAHREHWGNQRLARGAYADSPEFRQEAS
jgi:hypothetical protein